MFRSVINCLKNVIVTTNNNSPTSSSTMLRNYASTVPKLRNCQLKELSNIHYQSSSSPSTTTTTTTTPNLLNSELVQKCLAATVLFQNCNPNKQFKRLPSPNCIEGAYPPKCIKYRPKYECIKIAPPMPNFNECRKTAPKQKPDDECNCYRKYPPCSHV